MVRLHSALRALFLNVIWLSVVWAPPPRGETTDETALLIAIRDNPDEDTPRLVYADWLDEHDRPERAEFIRLQVELARMDEKDSKYEAKKDRERALLQNPKATALPDYFAKSPPEIRERRRLKPITKSEEETQFLNAMFDDPFEDTPRLAYADWLEENGHDREAELIRVVIRDYRSGVFNQSAWRRRIAGLTKSTRVDPLVLSFVEIKTVPVYRRGFLEELIVPGEVLRTAGENPLPSTPFLRKLSVLGDMTGDPARINRIIATLAESDVAPRLESLHMRQISLTEENIRTLAGKLDRLRHLAIGPRRLSVAALIQLLETPLAARLLSLEVFPIIPHADAHRVRAALNGLFQRKPELKRVDSTLHLHLPPEQQSKLHAITLHPDSMCSEFLHSFVQPYS